MTRTEVHFSTATASMFSYNSGRARRRKRRSAQWLGAAARKNERHEIVAQQSIDPASVDHAPDQRTVMDVLFPNPYKDEELTDRIIWPQTFSKWREVLRDTWKEYRSSWDGFTKSKGILVEDSSEIERQVKETEYVLISKREEVTKNLKRNTVFMKIQAEALRKDLQNRTGVNSVEDLKKWAADTMRLASECVNQFMAGYRKGRDDEVEKMLTQYFQELEKEANKLKRRRRQKRVLNRFHPMN